MNPRDKIGPTLEAARSRQSTFRKRDVRVLIETMKEAGLSIARVEIAADGQITVVHGAPTVAAPAEQATGQQLGDKHPWDE